jgi:spore germination protein YaaH
MHWMTVFMFNNHTLPHPDSLVPGSRISIGRPYIVRDGDSLYSIATKYGTTWQQIKALNPAIILDEKSLFVGQLLCIAPDLAFVNCRNRY